MRLIKGFTTEHIHIGLLVWLISACSTFGGVPPTPSADIGKTEYTLGPDDQIKLWALGMEEISDKPVRLDSMGYFDLPVLGRIKAGGMTVQELREELAKRLAPLVREPRVTIDIVEYGSQPVSIMGAVAQPGVHQLRGGKTLAEMISLAGGLRPDAGPEVKIMRKLEWGMIPLPNARMDESGMFSIAEVKVKSFLAADIPAENIVIRPHDIITVPRTEMVYVVGAVRKPGGISLGDRGGISVLEALSLAEGLGPASSANNSKILRVVSGSVERQEVAIKLSQVLSGKEKDVNLQPNDILFVPDSAGKRATTRAIEATIQTLTGIAIYRRPGL